MTSTSVSHSVLPWSSSASENKRFSHITQVSLIVTLCAALWVNLVEVPSPSKVEVKKRSPQLTRLIVAKPPEPKKVEPPKPQPKPEPKPIEKPKPTKKEKPKPVLEQTKPVPKPVPKPDPKTDIATAKAKAQQSGLLAFKDDLANMRQDISLNNLANTEAIKGGGQQAKTERKRVGTLTNNTSGGVTSGKLSSNIGAKGELAGRRSTEFVAPTEGVASLAAKQVQQQSQVLGNRNVEDIRKIIGEHKGAIYSLYRKALRKNPELEGRVSVQLVIEPDGSISEANILTSELSDEKLEKRLLSRIKMIQFGSQSVTQTQLDYAFNFLPF